MNLIGIRFSINMLQSNALINEKNKGKSLTLVPFAFDCCKIIPINACYSEQNNSKTNKLIHLNGLCFPFAILTLWDKRECLDFCLAQLHTWITSTKVPFQPEMPWEKFHHWKIDNGCPVPQLICKSFTKDP